MFLRLEVAGRYLEFGTIQTEDAAPVPVDTPTPMVTYADPIGMGADFVGFRARTDPDRLRRGRVPQPKEATCSDDS